MAVNGVLASWRSHSTCQCHLCRWKRHRQHEQNWRTMRRLPTGPPSRRGVGWRRGLPWWRSWLAELSGICERNLVRPGHAARARVGSSDEQHDGQSRLPSRSFQCHTRPRVKSDGLSAAMILRRLNPVKAKQRRDLTPNARQRVSGLPARTG